MIATSSKHRSLSPHTNTQKVWPTQFDLHRESGTTFRSKMLGKRHHPIATDTTSVRRHKEAQTIYDIANHLPLGKDQLERANQSILLRLAVQYIKMRRLFRDTFKGARLLGFSQELFQGFVMVVDLKGTVVYASESITQQLGPQLVDVIGLPFLDVLHAEDSENLRKIQNVTSAEDLQEKAREFFPCVLRMKTNVSPTVRSQAKVQYKDVFVTFRVKKYASIFEPEAEQEDGDAPEDDYPQPDSDTSSVMAVLLCRTEAHIGIPDLIINAQFTYCTDLKHHFVSGDKMAEWLTGYKIPEVVGVSCFVMKHPADVHDTKEYTKRTKILFKEGYFIVAPYRIVTAWGQWIWLESKAYPIVGKNGEPSGIRFFCKIVGAADQHDFMQSLKDSSTQAFDGSPLTTGSTYFHSSPSSIQTYPQYDSPSSLHSSPCSYQDGPSSVHTSPHSYQDGPSSVHNSPRSYQDSPSSIHNSPRSYQDGPSSLHNSPRSYQDGPSSIHNSPRSYQDGPSSLHNSPRSYQDGPNSLQSSPQYYQDTPSSFQSNPQYYQDSPGSLQNSPRYQQDSSPGSQYYHESPRKYTSSTESHLSSFQHSPQSFSSDEWVESVTPFNPSLPTAGTKPSPAWHLGSNDLPAAYSSLSISNGSRVTTFPTTSYSASLQLKVEPTDFALLGDLSLQAPLSSGEGLPSWEALNTQRMPAYSGPSTVKQQMVDGGCLFNSTQLIHNMH